MNDNDSAQQSGQTSTGNTSSSQASNPLGQNDTFDLRQMSQQAGTKHDDQYDIPPEVEEKYPDLVASIKETASMNFEERQYWFQILPIMNAEQVEKLRQILVQEKDQLKKLDEEYAGKLQTLNDKHQIEWEDFQRRKKQDELTQAEKKEEGNEQKVEEELLKKLQDI